MKTLIATILLAATATLAHADEFTLMDKGHLEKIVDPAHWSVIRLEGSYDDWKDLQPEAKQMELAAACSAAVKDALARGADPKATMSFVGFVAGKATRDEIAIGDAEASVCHALVEKAKGLDERLAAAKAAAIEAKLGPFKKLGVAGDKLGLLDKYWTEVLGPNAANPTPQVIAKSSVLFRLIKDDDWNYTLMRYQFRGNKQVKVTSQSFHHDPPASLYR